MTPDKAFLLAWTTIQGGQAQGGQRRVGDILKILCVAAKFAGVNSMYLYRVSEAQFRRSPSPNEVESSTMTNKAHSEALSVFPIEAFA